MLERAKNTVLISCLSVLSVISRFTFTAFLMVTLCFAATSAPPVKASDQPRQPAQAGTAQTNQSPTGQSPTVPNEPARQTVLDAARSADGVMRVENDLTVAPKH